VTDQIRYGLQDRVTQAPFPLIAVLVPRRFHQIHIDDLARAIRLNAERPDRSTVEVLHYPEFDALLKGLVPYARDNIPATRNAPCFLRFAIPIKLAIGNSQFR
jgi:hypothetical protein